MPLLPSKLARLVLLALPFAIATKNHAQDFSQPQVEADPRAGLVRKANDALTAGDLATALDLLTRLNSQSPNNPQVLYNIGLTLEALAEKPQADRPATASSGQLTPESAYRQSVAANPLYAPAHVALGLLLARTGHTAEARSELATALTIPDIDPMLKSHALRAMSRIDVTTNSGTASAELLQAIQLSSEQPDDILLSAQIADAAHDNTAAAEAYRRYLALPHQAGSIDSDQREATAGLVHALLAQQRTSEAQAVLKRALARYPGDPALTAQLAEIYASSNDPAQMTLAAPLLEKLHRDNPEDANVTRLLARVYVDTDHADQAEPLYADLISGAGNKPDPTLLDDRAAALIRLHRPTEAEKLLQQALADPSKFPTREAVADAALHLAFAASEADQPTVTLQALALRATVQAPSPASLFLEATANDALHQSSKAAELYRQFLSVANGNFPEQQFQARKRIAELAHVK